MSEDKQALREEIWRSLEKSGDARFPGAQGRIPNFDGRADAARRLFDHPAYGNAKTIKINPDSPQTPVREQALKDGKTLYMAAPKLRERKCFIELDPNKMTGSPSDWKTIKGAFNHGTPVHPEAMESVDLIVTGVVGTDREGHRLGKGGGYSDLEFAVLVEFDLIDPYLPILSTLHPVQELETGRIPREPQDITLSGYYRPDGYHDVEDSSPRPGGLETDRLSEEQFESIPILPELIERKSRNQTS